MGLVIDLGARRQGRPVSAGVRPTSRRTAELLFDLADPCTYLVAERVDRAVPALRWTPASGAALGGRDALAADHVRRAVEARARELGMPLQWPDGYPAQVPAAMRAAAYASEEGRGAAFVVAAARLAFCGGFHLDAPEVLAEAAAAAGLGLEGVLAAAGDAGRDAAIERAALRLLAVGAAPLPVLRLGRRTVCGEPRISALTRPLRS